MEETAVLKADFMRNFERDDSVLIVIDDDPKNLTMIHEAAEDVVLLKETVLID